MHGRFEHIQKKQSISVKRTKETTSLYQAALYLTRRTFANTRWSKVLCTEIIRRVEGRDV